MKAAALALLLLPGVAQAGSITVRNGGGETIRGIYMAPVGAASVGENRMRSQLPPGAEARFTYSTGCRADVRLGYESGRTEDHKDVDTCADTRIVAGQDGVAGPAMARTAPSTAKKDAKAPKPDPVATAVKAPPPVVPPWTGKSITKRFGGLD